MDRYELQTGFWDQTVWLMYCTGQERSLRDFTAITSGLECGDVCTYGKGRAWMPSPPQCALVWLRLLSSCPAAAWPPPKEPPPDLLDAYTMGGQIARGERYFQRRYSGKQALTPAWEPANLDAALRPADVESMSNAVLQTRFS